jgi:Uma2 family endonuclease
MRKVFPESAYWIRVHAPLWLGNDSEPEPDVAVTKGAESDYSDIHHPTTALIVIEVAQTSLAVDRADKASLYASAGIADYWILNLQDRQLEVHRKPVKGAEQRFGHRYSKITILKSGDSISPLAAKTRRIAVADLLP